MPTLNNRRIKLLSRPIWAAIIILVGCARGGGDSFSAEEVLGYPKISPNADKLVSLSTNKDNTRFSVDGKPIGQPINAGGELKILVNNQEHDFLATVPGYKDKPHHTQPPYTASTPISFEFIYVDKLGYSATVASAGNATVNPPPALPSPLATQTNEPSPLPGLVSDDKPLPIPSNISSLGNYVALVIGNDHYEHTKNLKTAFDDVDAIKTLLENKYGFHVKPIRDGTRHEILGALAELQKNVDSSTNVLIYYAGHGHYEDNEQRGYWLPIDAELDNPDNWIANDDVTSRVRAMPAKHVLVIADSCFSGSMIRSIGSGQLGLNRGLIRVEDELPNASEEQRPDNSTTAIENYLLKLSRKKARMVMTSGGLEPVVDAGGSGNHSVFASAFLSVLEDAEGVIEGTLLFNKIRKKVSFNAEQTPAYGVIKNAGHDEGDFLFVPQEGR